MDTNLVTKLLCLGNEEDVNIVVSLIKTEADIFEYLWITNILFASEFQAMYRQRLIFPLMGFITLEELMDLDHTIFMMVALDVDSCERTEILKELQWI